MGALRTEHTLAWRAKLAPARDGGYTSWELRDERGRRWAWVINAAESGWTAHTGDYGQAEMIGEDRVPIRPEQAKQFMYLTEAKDWCEQEVAHQWREMARA